MNQITFKNLSKKQKLEWLEPFENSKKKIGIAVNLPNKNDHNNKQVFGTISYPTLKKCINDGDYDTIPFEEIPCISFNKTKEYTIASFMTEYVKFTADLGLEIPDFPKIEIQKSVTGPAQWIVLDTMTYDDVIYRRDLKMSNTSKEVLQLKINDIPPPPPSNRSKRSRNSSYIDDLTDDDEMEFTGLSPAKKLQTSSPVFTTSNAFQRIGRGEVLISPGKKKIDLVSVEDSIIEKTNVEGTKLPDECVLLLGESENTLKGYKAKRVANGVSGYLLNSFDTNKLSLLTFNTSNIFFIDCEKINVVQLAPKNYEQKIIEEKYIKLRETIDAANLITKMLLNMKPTDNNYVKLSSKLDDINNLFLN